MRHFTVQVSLAGVSLAGVLLPSLLLAVASAALAQTAPTGQFGQRTSSGSYLPSTSDPNCVGIICNPLPSANASGGLARSPSEVAPPPPCQGLLCSLTPYSMQRPYTASESAAAERQRAAAQAQAAAAPSEAMPARHARKRHKGTAVKAAARTPAPADAAQ